jgi:hypothetical protein
MNRARAANGIPKLGTIHDLDYRNIRRHRGTQTFDLIAAIVTCVSRDNHNTGFAGAKYGPHRILPDRQFTRASGQTEDGLTPPNQQALNLIAQVGRRATGTRQRTAFGASAFDQCALSANPDTATGQRTGNVGDDRTVGRNDKPYQTGFFAWLAGHSTASRGFVCAAPCLNLFLHFNRHAHCCADF